ncbi:hypothetical protein MAA_00064 [Metarhizium robertsii ARSEF 23]|uniref:Uncharacterized protein n=1 Tax=Metarhizium robertsii (strain ARSEF 23 / ATCC MYA-3075) TaxID=655844 RepID=E9EJJ4_METRA|nr:uncharacterized protein MAA_00064 [Metarhizium robertsii ARSEF 23]EFZ02990.2 hypothetical protein MAA_00064 [Metarhizium robertsii ARSEF 23]
MSTEAPVPIAGRIICMGISLLSTTALTLFLTQRCLVIKSWTRLPILVWLVFAIYVDSYMFVFATAILQQSIGVNSSLTTCQGAILLCLACYVTTKTLADEHELGGNGQHFVRGTTKKRMHSKLYMFNCFGMLGLYVVVGILNVVFRIAKLENGVCEIGMKSAAMIPLLAFDTVANIYLTILFLVPLRNLYSYKSMPRTPAILRLRSVATRTLCGAMATLLSSIVNIAVLMALGGEAGWICLLCCNCDILFSAIVIQWITSKDNAGTASTASTDGEANRQLKPTATQELKPCALPSTCSALGSDSLSAMDRCSTRSDTNTDGPHGCGGILVTTTIKREEMQPDGTKRSRDGEKGTIQTHESYLAEEGRVHLDGSVGDDYNSVVADGCGGYKTIITAEPSPAQQPRRG